MAHAEALAAAQNQTTSCEIVALQKLELPFFIDHREDGQWPPSKVLEDLYKKMLDADIIVLATPLYWFSVSNYMKNFLDHWTTFLRHKEFPMGSHFENTAFVSLVVGGGPAENPAELPIYHSMKASIAYIKAQCMGGIYGVGLREGSPDENTLSKVKAVDLLKWKNSKEERYL